jgi:hypothetical protein
MPPILTKRQRFPTDIIRQAMCLCFRFALSFRDVEEMLAQHRGQLCDHPALGEHVRPTDDALNYRCQHPRALLGRPECSSHRRNASGHTLVYQLFIARVKVTAAEAWWFARKAHSRQLLIRDLAAHAHI